VAGVIALHAAGLWAFAKLRPLPVREHVPPPNFTFAEARTTDPETGEKLVVREFTVSTRLDEEAREAAPE
jgi:hypothetical protein